jgi:PhnB protein
MGISRASTTQIPAQKEARRLTDPLKAQTLTAYRIVKNTGGVIQYYKKAFGAKELLRIEAPRGLVGHAELRIEHRR